MVGERPVFAFIFQGLVYFPRTGDLPVIAFPSEALFQKRIGKKGRQAFVEPEVGPILAGDADAVPLVRQLVGQQPQVFGVSRQIHLVGLRQQGESHHLLLHSALREYLRVGCARECHAGFFG